jgi:hypothetical protein
VQGLCVLASASQLGSDRGSSVAEDTFCGGRIQPFGERRQHHCDLLGGGFQAVQGGVASSTASHVTGLATECLDLLNATMYAISNQGVDVSVCDAEVRALVVGTGEALSVYPFGSTPSAFDLAPGAHRKRRRFHTRREGGGDAAGWTIKWGAWLEQTLDS